jgi:hypothetical protein
LTVSGTIALDLSKRSTGYAVWMPDWDMPRCGCWQLGSEYTSDGRTFAKLHQNLSDLRKLARFENLYLEEPIHPASLSGHTNIDTLRVLAGLAAHAESFGAAVGLRIVSRVNVSSWRKHFVGKMPRGTKSKQWKDYAMERCRQYGFSPRKDDEADALGILDYACDLQGIVPPWRANEVLRPALAVGGRR